MRRTLLTLALVAAAVGSARGDGILLADGRKVSGRVVEKPDGYEVTIEGQTVGYTKADVKQWFKSPKEVLGDADKQVEDAKKLYTEAVNMSDEKAAEAKFREALPKVQKAREAYVEARELFPDGYPALDEQLVNVMKLMRLVRERFHSQIASAESSSPVKLKESPAPVSKPPVRPDPVKPPEPTKPAPVESASTGTLHEALLVLVDPAKRDDAAQRASAIKVFQKASTLPGPAADIATAGWLFLAKTDFDWGLSADVVTVKSSGPETVYKGRLDKRSDAITVLILADRREVRIRTASDGRYITPPAGAEFKAADYKVVDDQKTDALDALQAFFKILDAAKMETLEDKDVSDGVKLLAAKVKDLKAKNQPVDGLVLRLQVLHLRREQLHSVGHVLVFERFHFGRVENLEERLQRVEGIGLLVVDHLVVRRLELGPGGGRDVPAVGRRPDPHLAAVRQVQHRDRVRPFVQPALINCLRTRAFDRAPVRREAPVEVGFRQEEPARGGDVGRRTRQRGGLLEDLDRRGALGGIVAFGRIDEDQQRFVQGPGRRALHRRGFRRFRGLDRVGPDRRLRHRRRGFLQLDGRRRLGRCDLRVEPLADEPHELHDVDQLLVEGRVAVGEQLARLDVRLARLLHLGQGLAELRLGRLLVRHVDGFGIELLRVLDLLVGVAQHLLGRLEPLLHVGLGVADGLALDGDLVAVGLFHDAAADLTAVGEEDAVASRGADSGSDERQGEQGSTHDGPLYSNPYTRGRPASGALSMMRESDGSFDASGGVDSTKNPLSWVFSVFFVSRC